MEPLSSYKNTPKLAIEPIMSKHVVIHKTGSTSSEEERATATGNVHKIYIRRRDF